MNLSHCFRFSYWELHQVGLCVFPVSPFLGRFLSQRCLVFQSPPILALPCPALPWNQSFLQQRFLPVEEDTVLRKQDLGECVRLAAALWLPQALRGDRTESCGFWAGFTTSSGDCSPCLSIPSLNFFCLSEFLVLLSQSWGWMNSPLASVTPGFCSCCCV